MDNPTTVDGLVAEIMRMHRSLPPRPGIEEVEAAKMLVKNVEREEQLKLEAIAKQPKPKGVSEEIFFIYQEMQRILVKFLCKEQMKEALNLLDLENAHQVFDELIQRAYQCVSSQGSGSGHGQSSGKGKERDFGGGDLKSRDLDSVSASQTSLCFDKEGSKSSSKLVSMDDSYIKKAKASFHVDGFSSQSAVPQIVDSTLRTATSSAQDGEKLSLIKLASLIELSAKKGTKELNLEGKLSDQVEWLPDSIGKLSSLVSLDLSENRIVALPDTIGGLSSLERLDLHSNRISQLPESIGNLLNLVFLDLRGNNLATLPPSIGRLVRLEELDLGSNQLSSLPDTIGSLVNLKRLNLETNDLEELPHTIGQCTSLQELHVDYNRLKALPEAVGKIGSLEILTVRYNNVRLLPTTMSTLNKLKELDVSFNEVESVPESLGFATSLVKLNISNNFADLRSLPRSLGNLEMLEELDISNNQIRVLPESFRFLRRLTVLRADQNPLEVPPRHIAEKGAQAVVQYMTDLVENKDVKAPPVKQKKSWTTICFFSRSNKRKRNNSAEYAKT